MMRLHLWHKDEWILFEGENLKEELAAQKITRISCRLKRMEVEEKCL